MIHEYQIKIILKAEVYCLLAASRGCYLHSVSGEDPLCDYEVHGFVIHHQSVIASEIQPGLLGALMRGPLPSFIQKLYQRKTVEGLLHNDRFGPGSQINIVARKHDHIHFRGQHIYIIAVNVVFQLADDEMCQLIGSDELLQSFKGIGLMDRYPQISLHCRYHRGIEFTDPRDGSIGKAHKPAQADRILVIESHAGRGIGYFLRNAHSHRGSGIRLTVDLDKTAHCCHQSVDDSHTEPETACGP